MEQKPQLAVNLFGKVSPNLAKVKEIDIASIVPNPDQPRQTFNEDSLRELADSIARHGLLQPVTVKRKEDEEGKYTLVAGERRFRAHQLLGRLTIPSIVLTSGNTDELSIIENLQREDLNPIEEAEALAKLMARYDYTQEALGKVIGKAQATVSNLLNLTKLPTQIKQEYSTSNNRVSKSLLMEIARHDNAEEQLQLWQAAKLGSATVRTARQAKKDKTAVPQADARLAQTLAAGTLFARHLQSLQAAELADSPSATQALSALRERINQQLEALQLKRD